MKSTKYLCAILITVLTSQLFFGQEKLSINEINLPKHEIKINALALIALSSLDITYENVINSESSVGISLYVYAGNPENDSGDEYKTFSLTPYYRNYFSSKYNKGFFIEGFGMIHSRRLYSTKKTATDFALGIAVGGKWVTKNGFIAEVSFGLGRVLFNNDEDDYGAPPIVGRGGISIGKRF